MSRRDGSGGGGSSSSRLDLKLNLSPPPPQQRGQGRRTSESPNRSATVSPPSSCVSSEPNSNSPETASSMVVVGCPRCLMYVMLSENEPRCPKCKSTVLLDFQDHHHQANDDKAGKS